MDHLGSFVITLIIVMYLLSNNIYFTMTIIGVHRVLIPKNRLEDSGIPSMRNPVEVE